MSYLGKYNIAMLYMYYDNYVLGCMHTWVGVLLHRCLLLVQQSLELVDESFQLSCLSVQHQLVLGARRLLHVLQARLGGGHFVLDDGAQALDLCTVAVVVQWRAYAVYALLKLAQVVVKLLQ